jgi:hypothetical protein
MAKDVTRPCALPLVNLAQLGLELVEAGLPTAPAMQQMPALQTITFFQVPNATTNAQLDAVIAAHNPVKPVADADLAGTEARTSNASSKVISRYPLPTSSAARAEIRVTASDGTSVAFWWLVLQVKRGVGNAIAVGTMSEVVPAKKDAGASTWAAVLSVEAGTPNVILTVTGEAGKNIRWVPELSGRLFNP